MKRLIAAVVLLILLAAAGIMGNRLIVSRCETLFALLDECEADFYAGNGREACDRLEEYYVRQEDLLSAFVNHDAVEEVGLSIARLNGYAGTQSQADFAGECAVLRARIIHIRNQETIGVDSLL